MAGDEGKGSVVRPRPLFFLHRDVWCVLYCLHTWCVQGTERKTQKQCPSWHKGRAVKFLVLFVRQETASQRRDEAEDLTLRKKQRTSDEIVLKVKKVTSLFVSLIVSFPPSLPPNLFPSLSFRQISVQS